MQNVLLYLFFLYKNIKQPMDLVEACKCKDTEKALGLIMNNNTNLGIVDTHGRTLKTHHQR